MTSSSGRAQTLPAIRLWRFRRHPHPQPGTSSAIRPETFAVNRERTPTRRVLKFRLNLSAGSAIAGLLPHASDSGCTCRLADDGEMEFRCGADLQARFL